MSSITPYTPMHDRGLFTRLTKGIVPCTVFMIGALSVCVIWNVELAKQGSLGFSQVDGIAASGSASGSLALVFVFRFLAACACLYVMAHDMYLNGRYTFCFFTLWTWWGMAGYFIQASIVSATFWMTGAVPPKVYVDILWIWFEISYASTCLVFVAVWLALVPMAHAVKDEGSIAILWSWRVLFQHNVNMLIMEAELLLSMWTVRPEHVFFCLYFGMIYAVVNHWILQRAGGFQPYFFMDYDKIGVLGLVILILLIYSFFWLGVLSSDMVGKG